MYYIYICVVLVLLFHIIPFIFVVGVRSVTKAKYFNNKHLLLLFLLGFVLYVSILNVKLQTGASIETLPLLNYGMSSITQIIHKIVVWSDFYLWMSPFVSAVVCIFIAHYRNESIFKWFFLGLVLNFSSWNLLLSKKFILFKVKGESVDAH